MTTHSDYIIKEFNTLLMLNQKHTHLTQLMRDEGYGDGELLSASRVRSYMAMKDKIVLDWNVRRSTCLTLVPATISQESGIELQSFDETIEEMNRIQDAIVWGGDERD